MVLYLDADVGVLKLGISWRPRLNRQSGATPNSGPGYAPDDTHGIKFVQLRSIAQFPIMSKVPEVENIEAKNEVDVARPPSLAHDEVDKLGIIDPHSIVSQADDLTLIQTIRTYPKATLLCAFAAFGAISDGYQYALPGSIVALPGFIQQFGSQNAAGTYALNPQYVALWGGEQSVPIYTA